MKQRLFEEYKKEPFYVVKDDINIEGSCLQEYVTLSPKSVVSTFGDPEDSDGYKVSGEYMFKEKNTKNVYTLYDWKNTILYDSDLIRPSEFWNSTEEYNFHIGASSDKNVKSFKRWIKKYTN
mgnify:FL=1